MGRPEVISFFPGGLSIGKMACYLISMASFISHMTAKFMIKLKTDMHLFYIAEGWVQRFPLLSPINLGMTLATGMQPFGL